MSANRSLHTAFAHAHLGTPISYVIDILTDGELHWISGTPISDAIRICPNEGVTVYPPRWPAVTGVGYDYYSRSFGFARIRGARLASRGSHVITSPNVTHQYFLTRRDTSKPGKHWRTAGLTLLCHPIKFIRYDFEYQLQCRILVS